MTVWTPEQVLLMERRQRASNLHPYTCGNRSDGHLALDGGDFGLLVPTVRGWICPFCDYTQSWSHEINSGAFDPDDPEKRPHRVLIRVVDTRMAGFETVVDIEIPGSGFDFGPIVHMPDWVFPEMKTHIVHGSRWIGYANIGARRRDQLIVVVEHMAREPRDDDGLA